MSSSTVPLAFFEVLKSKLTEVRTLFRTREEIYQDAYEGRQFHFLYFAMMVFACLISLLGLLLNSPAVIIGAMLISPLMGPTLSCGLALTLADWDLGRKAGRNAVLSVVETILIALLATWLSPLKEATPEILARTTPNLMDLLIAFFSGLAGTLALASRKGGLTILPGVAIATAVMPPLATVGYGLSTRQWGVASGAFMLFFTNFTAIVISADLVFLLIGFRPRQVHARDEHVVLVKWRIVIASLVLVALSVPLLRTLLRAAQQTRVRREIAAVLHLHFDRPGQRRLANMDIKAAQKPLLVDSVVQTERYIEPHEINLAEAELNNRLRTPVRLVVEQIQLAHQPAGPPTASMRSGNDFLAGGLVRSGLGPGYGQPPAEILARLQDRVTSLLEPLLRSTGVRDLEMQGMAMRGDKLLVEFSGRQSDVLDYHVWRVMSAALEKELGTGIRIRAVLRLDKPGTQAIRFRQKSRQATAAEYRKARLFLAPWRSKPGVRSALFASAACTPQLREERVVVLRQKLSWEPGLFGLDSSLPEDMVQLQIVQVVDVDKTEGATTEEGSGSQGVD